MNKYYGSDRDICKDIGGFACIVESKDDVDELKKEYYLDLNNDIFEEEEILDHYIARLYILSCDYSIKVYFRKELIEWTIWYWALLLPLQVLLLQIKLWMEMINVMLGLIAAVTAAALETFTKGAVVGATVYSLTKKNK